MGRTTSAALRFLLLGGVAAPSIRAQQVLFEYAYGRTVSQGANIGDWDGDGIADFAIQVEDDTRASYAGAVLVISGADGSTFHTWYGKDPDDYFGNPVAMPDIDGDGKNELLVLVANSDQGGTDRGSAYLFAGGTGNQLWRVDGTTRWLGTYGGPTSDFDGDGAADVFLGEYTYTKGFDLRVVSGATGALLFSLPTPNGSYSVADIGDVNADGLDDFLVGADTDSTAAYFAGSFTIYSGADQSVLYTQMGTKSYEFLGLSCSRVGDVDGDGLRDYAVVSLENYPLASAVVLVFSAASNALLGEIKSPDLNKTLITWLVDGVSDVNGDGVEDLILGVAPKGSSAAPVVYSGRTLTRLYGFEGLPTGDWIQPGRAGDFDGDGTQDLIALQSNSSTGRFRILGGNRLWLDVDPRSPILSAPLALTTREGPSGNLTILAIVGVDFSPTFQVVNGLGMFDATGSRMVSGNVPPALSGHVLDFTAFADLGTIVASAVERVRFP